jgi:hypothetical protein
MPTSFETNFSWRPTDQVLGCLNTFNRENVVAYRVSLLSFVSACRWIHLLVMKRWLVRHPVTLPCSRLLTPETLCRCMPTHTVAARGRAMCHLCSWTKHDFKKITWNITYVNWLYFLITQYRSLLLPKHLSFALLFSLRQLTRDFQI